MTTYHVPTGHPAHVTFGALTPARDAAALIIALQTFVAVNDHRQPMPPREQVATAVATAEVLLGVMGQPRELDSPFALNVPADHLLALPAAHKVWPS